MLFWKYLGQFVKKKNKSMYDILFGFIKRISSLLRLIVNVTKIINTIVNVTKSFIYLSFKSELRSLKISKLLCFR